MVKKKEKGFTLIELIAVLVIMAILALIVTPLVMSIIKKAKVSADKRSIDAYGRSIELAIAGYLLDNGSFPTSIEQLTIEYSGDEVVCSTIQLNSDSSVYLAGCTVAGRTVDYAYGADKTPTYQVYNVGDEVTYNNVLYRVIKDSGAKESAVTLLKLEPLTVEEVNFYGLGHVNMHTQISQETAYNVNGYGGIAYYTSSNCLFNGGGSIYGGCTTDYESSEIKYIVDAWATDKASNGLQEARLIQYDEIIDNFDYERKKINPSTEDWVPSATTPSWLYNDRYFYWTMSSFNDSSKDIWVLSGDGTFNNREVCRGYTEAVIRPVIVLSKSVL